MDIPEFNTSSQPVRYISSHFNRPEQPHTQAMSQPYKQDNQTRFGATTMDDSNEAKAIQSSNDNHITYPVIHSTSARTTTNVTNTFETAMRAVLHPSRLQLLQGAGDTHELERWNFAEAREYAKLRSRSAVSQPTNSDIIQSDPNTSQRTRRGPINSSSNISSRTRSRTGPQATPIQKNSKKLGKKSEKQPKQKQLKRKNSKKLGKRSEKQPKQKQLKQKKAKRNESYLRLLAKGFGRRQGIRNNESALQRLSLGHTDNGRSEAASEKLDRLLLENDKGLQMAIQFETEAVAKKPTEREIDDQLKDHATFRKTEKFITYFTGYRKQFRKAIELIEKLDVPGFPDLGTALQLIIAGERSIGSLQEYLNDGLLDFDSHSTLVEVAKILDSHTKRHLTKFGLQVSEMEENLRRLQQHTTKQNDLSWPAEPRQIVTNNYSGRRAGRQDYQGHSKELPIVMDDDTESSSEDSDPNDGEQLYLRRPTFAVDNVPSATIHQAEYHYNMGGVEAEHHILGVVPCDRVT